MSAGSFETAFYITDNGDTVPIRVQPSTPAAQISGSANAGATGPATDGFPSAQVSQSKRALGINARTVSFRMDAPLTGYKPDSILRIPVMTKSIWDSISKGTVITYQGSPGKAVGKSPEKIN